ncbi:MAG: GNAT family N-acetyltransferase, partial [Bryobacteraceae bacterium]|nr:GNAT family N-acetyltransferase [Bryobacteraceae bacterium]
MPEITVERLDWRQWSGLAPHWERIHRLSPNASFFLSRSWVDCWLSTFGDELKPELLAFRKGGEIAGCCLLVCRTQWEWGIPLRRIFLNCAGENEEDSTCIEHNSLLSLPEVTEPVAKALWKYLLGRSWDELHLEAMISDCGLCREAESIGGAEISEQPVRYVDLARLRAEGVDFDNVLSAKARKNIRRTHRAYDQIGGTCAVRSASSAEEAIAMLRQLAGLHQVSWTGRGRPGVFSSPKFVSFHESLIRRTFSDGRILLFEARTGSEVIGILYCFIDRGWIRFYQCGFNYALDARQSPGLLTLYLLIRQCLERQEYQALDFLAGDMQYKRSLATDSQNLRWMVVRRLTAPSLVFRGLRSLKRAYRGMAEGRRQANPPAEDAD